MSEKQTRNDDDTLEYTTSVKQGHAKIGKFNLVCYAILTVVCIVYLIRHFKP